MFQKENVHSNTTLIIRQGKDLGSKRNLQTNKNHDILSNKFNLHRCFKRTMGFYNVQGKFSTSGSRKLECVRKNDAYKLKRTSCHSKSPSFSPNSKSKRSYLLRQPYGSVRYQQTGINKLQSKTTDIFKNSRDLPSEKCDCQSELFKGFAKHCSRCFIEASGKNFIRINAIKKCIRENLSNYKPQSKNRFIRNKSNNTATNICLLNTRQKRLSIERFLIRLGKIRGSLRFSPSPSNPKSNFQMEKRKERKFTDSVSANVTSEKLLYISKKACKTNIKTGNIRGGFVDTNRRDIHTLSREKISNIRMRPLKQMVSEFPENIQNKMVHTVRMSSEKQYQFLWDKFAKFVCKTYSGRFPKSAIYEFFNHLIDSKYNYNSLLRFRTALQKPIAYYFSNWSLKNDVDLSNLLNYAKTHILKPKVNIAPWDLDKVLLMLKKPPNSVVNNIDFKIKKSVFLAVLANPLRISEFQAITISKSTINEEFAILRSNQKLFQKTILIILYQKI